MPVDDYGVRAEVIMDGDSTIKRMNPARFYYQYITATSAMITRRVQARITQDPSPESYAWAWDYLTRYYAIVSPRMYETLTGPSYTGTPQHHVDAVVRDGVYLYVPTDNSAYTPEYIHRLMHDPEFTLEVSPVQYTGSSGIPCRTVNDVLIGSLYLVLLEKTGDDYSAVASGRLQHFGVLAKLTKQDRYNHYVRTQPVRFAGETEVRLMSAYMGGVPTAHLLERSNNPAMHKHVVANILRAPLPTQIESVVDRTQFPKSGARPQTYINHTLECSGIRFNYVPYDRHRGAV